MSKSIVTRARARLVIACLVVAGALFALAACGGSSDKSSTASGGGSSGSVDDGSKITMWTRAATSAYSQLLVDAYNKGHKNQVKLTVIPTDSYQPKIAAAAGGHSLPDVFSADVVFAPNYTSKGLLADITSRVNALTFKDALAPGHIRRRPTGQDLRGAARARPLGDVLEQGPVQEGGPRPREAAHDGEGDRRSSRARSTRSAAASTAPSSAATAAAATLHLVADRSGRRAAPSSTTTARSPPSTTLRRPRSTGSTSRCPPTGSSTRSQERAGPDVDRRLPQRQGRRPARCRRPPRHDQGDKDLKVGVAPIAGRTAASRRSSAVTCSASPPRASTPTRRGTSSPGRCRDEAQVEVMAKNKDVLARTDLAGNKYAPEDPRRGDHQLARSARGRRRTRCASAQTYNDPQGPWLESGARRSFGGDAEGRSRAERARSPSRCRARLISAGECGRPHSRRRCGRARRRRALAPAWPDAEAQRARAGRAYAAPTAVIVGAVLPGAAGARRLDVAQPLAVARRARRSTRRRTTRRSTTPCSRRGRASR